MNRRILILPVVILIAAIACGGGSGTSSNSSRSSAPSEPKRGWLCDFDSTGSIRLWTAASMDATVKDVVGTCVSCCVDVTMHEEEMTKGILFYRISVGSQSGWVDVDYFYWSKPGWSAN
jgi:hypothetical protein